MIRTPIKHTSLSIGEWCDLCEDLEEFGASIVGIHPDYVDVVGPRSVLPTIQALLDAWSGQC